jgi:hypothetical protein
MIHNEKQARDPMKMKLELIYSLLFFLFDCFFKQISKKNHKQCQKFTNFENNIYIQRKGMVRHVVQHIQKRKQGHKDHKNAKNT